MNKWKESTTYKLETHFYIIYRSQAKETKISILSVFILLFCLWLQTAGQSHPLPGSWVPTKEIDLSVNSSYSCPGTQLDRITREQQWLLPLSLPAVPPDFSFDKYTVLKFFVNFAKHYWHSSFTYNIAYCLFSSHYLFNAT